MKKPNFLSSYALRCGLVQSAQIPNRETFPFFSLELYHSLGVYHVRLFAHHAAKTNRLNWDCFSTFKQAKKHYKKLLKSEATK